MYSIRNKTLSIPVFVFTACYHVVAMCCILNIGSYKLVHNFPVSCRHGNYGNSITHVHFKDWTLRHASYKSRTLSVLLKYNCAYSGMPAMSCSIEHSCRRTQVCWSFLLYGL